MSACVRAGSFINFTLAISCGLWLLSRMKMLCLLLTCTSCVFASVAAPLSFDFKDPKHVNNVRFTTDALLESISGTGTGISGKVDFDPENPASLNGKIVLEAGSLTVPNPMMQEHLKGPMWLEVAKYPNITFEALSAENLKNKDNKWTAEVTGNLTVKNVTKKITVPVEITYLKGKLKDRFPQLQGDLLVLRSNFTIKRSDYNINKGNAEDKVSDDIDLKLSLAGQSPR
jgi:polyisoprenoid-binding protein YceI